MPRGSVLRNGHMSVGGRVEAGRPRLGLYAPQVSGPRWVASSGCSGLTPWMLMTTTAPVRGTRLPVLRPSLLGWAWGAQWPPLVPGGDEWTPRGAYLTNQAVALWS